MSIDGVRFLMQCRIFKMMAIVPFTKRLRLHHFNLDWAEILTNCSSVKYSLTDWVEFSIYHHTFKMAGMTSFHAEKV